VAVAVSNVQPLRALRANTLARRSSSTVTYWGDEGLTVLNYVRNQPVLATIDDLQILDKLDTWTSVTALRRQLPSETRQRLTRRLLTFREAGVIETDGAPPRREDVLAREWQDWSPVATWFHMATKDVPYGSPELAAQVASRRLDETEEIPRTRLHSGSLLTLPPFTRAGRLPKILVERRTWRRYGKRAVTLRSLSTLLGYTWAVQRWMHLHGGHRFPLKTSPSGGACHSIEVYVAALNVAGLKRGLYHYDSDEHGLYRLSDASRAMLRRYLPSQPIFSTAAAAFFMTAVFPRVQWKYRSPRAYRVVLMETGHLCQTFCLVATWLGLAPFCTAALGDSAIESDLGIDGLTETVLYAAGASPRPDGVKWAPFPSGERPFTSLPAWRRRLDRRSKSRR
jgi:SagB-type dehydrogenase family enzyme